MIDKRCFGKGHVKKEAYVLLDTGKLDHETRCFISLHLASCDACSSDYAEYLTEDILIDIPEDFNKEIINKARISIPAKKTSKNSIAMQYFKLATAAVLAICLYSTGVFNSFFTITCNINISRSEQYLQSGNENIAHKFNEGFSEFSKKINKLNGVDFYEKK